MLLSNFEGVSPQISEGCFLAPGSVVLGDVKFGQEVSFWFNSVARGDVGPISVGDESNIQDLCMLHITDNIPLVIGKQVSVGHKAILHSCTVEDNCLIGMGAVLLDKSLIGKNSLVAAGSVVPPGKIYPAGSMIMGNPAKVVRPLRESELQQYGQHYRSYIELKNRYLKDQKFSS